ncbi:MAG: hypothetical protein WA729_01970, partial [Pseudolabrys sp.]
SLALIVRSARSAAFSLLNLAFSSRNRAILFRVVRGDLFRDMLAHLNAVERQRLGNRVKHDAQILRRFARGGVGCMASSRRRTIVC